MLRVEGLERDSHDHFSFEKVTVELHGDYALAICRGIIGAS